MLIRSETSTFHLQITFRVPFENVWSDRNQQRIQNNIWSMQLHTCVCVCVLKSAQLEHAVSVKQYRASSCAIVLEFWHVRVHRHFQYTRNESLSDLDLECANTLKRQPIVRRDGMRLN